MTKGKKGKKGEKGLGRAESNSLSASVFTGSGGRPANTRHPTGNAGKAPGGKPRKAGPAVAYHKNRHGKKTPPSNIQYAQDFLSYFTTSTYKSRNNIRNAARYYGVNALKAVLRLLREEITEREKNPHGGGPKQIAWLNTRRQIFYYLYEYLQPRVNSFSKPVNDMYYYLWQYHASLF